MKNRAKISLLSVIATLLVQGCTYKKADGTYNEGPLFAHWTQKYYPKIHAQAIEDKKVLEFAKNCFTAAQDVKDANECNNGVLKRNPNFEDIEDFDKWNDETKKEVLEIIERNMHYLECMIAAKNITEMADRCDEPRDNITTTYLP